MINDYKSICEFSKDSNESSCSEVLTGTHEGWINYELGEVMPVGTYTLRLDGEKRPNFSYDWQIKTSGTWTTEWALWNATSGAVSYWTFDDSNQTTLEDLVGSNDGTFTGYTFNDGAVSGATLNSSGKYGNAYSFDGVNDYIVSGSNVTLGNNPFTVSF